MSMSKRQAIRKQREQKEKRNRMIGIGVALIGLAIILAVAIPYIFPSLGQAADADIVTPPDQKTYPDANNSFVGSADAPVTVTEFADYLCSHCQDYALNDESRFIEEYVATGKVLYEYIPVAFIAPSQTKSIEATYCAGDQNAFWPYKDLVYRNIVETQSALNNNYLTTYAKELGLDMDAFNNCLSSGKYRGKPQENLDRAREANIKGTPTFIVNGVEANRLNLFQVVEAELAKAQ